MNRRPAPELRKLLLGLGARNLDEAITDNPDGPIVMVTSRYATEIHYRVVVGESSDPRIIWDRSVIFGATDRTVAGGADFTAAARAQDEVAQVAHALLDAVGDET